MKLADKWGKPLFELMPDKFPWGRLTPVESGLWVKYFEDQIEQEKLRGR